MSKVTDTVAQLALPAVEAAGCSLWDVEYVKEAGVWYLRLYIDKAGGVSINDCEAVSRPVSILPPIGAMRWRSSSTGLRRAGRTMWAPLPPLRTEGSLFRPPRERNYLKSKTSPRFGFTSGSETESEKGD